MGEFEKLLTPRTRLVSVAHVSNALGTVNPVREIVDLAHARGIPVLAIYCERVALAHARANDVNQPQFFQTISYPITLVWTKLQCFIYFRAFVFWMFGYELKESSFIF